jgi:CBS domain containing-hemolysin-like protein
MRPVFFTSENQTTKELIASLRRANLTMAIVLDEHGATVGIVTMADAIAAVFGGIPDEYDSGSAVPADRVTVLDDKRIRVPGNLKLSELNALLGTSFDSEYYETVGGYLMEKASRLPARGETFLLGETTFRIEDVANRRILQVTITNT